MRFLKYGGYGPLKDILKNVGFDVVASVCEDRWRVGCDAVWSGTFIPMYVKRKIGAVRFSDMFVYI